MLIKAKECALVVIDMQERLMPHIFGNEELAQRCAMLINGLKLLKIPLLVTQQYTSPHTLKRAAPVEPLFLFPQPMTPA